MELRRSTREKKPPQHLQDFQLDLDPTESLQTRAIREELNQVESLLESLTPEAGKQSTSVSKLQSPILTPTKEKSAASISKLQNENFKLELELTRAKIELARVKSTVTHENQFKMANVNVNLKRQPTSTLNANVNLKPGERQRAESRPVYNPTSNCTHSDCIAV